MPTYTKINIERKLHSKNEVYILKQVHETSRRKRESQKKQEEQKKRGRAKTIADADLDQSREHAQRQDAARISRNFRQADTTTKKSEYLSYVSTYKFRHSKREGPSLVWNSHFSAIFAEKVNVSRAQDWAEHFACNAYQSQADTVTAHQP